MQQIELTHVPRRLQYYVQSHVAPEDHNTYWLLCWHVRHYVNGYRSHRVTFILSVLLIISTAIVSMSSGPVLTVTIVTLLVNFVSYIHFSMHKGAADRIYASDPDKWREIGEVAKPICDAHEPGDPEVSVTVTLPDE